jgi:hypothetical protein
VGVGAVAAAIDGHRSGNGLSWFFAVMFALACVAAALYVHSEDLATVAILPPLVFLVAAFVCAAFRPPDTGMPFVDQLRNEFLIAMLLGAPGLFLAEALTLAATGLRGARLRAIRRERLHRR